MILNREIVKKLINHYYNNRLLSLEETERKRDELINLFSENEFETFIKTFPNYQVELEKYIREIIKKAASKMHHSNNVSKKSYMNNKIIDLYLTFHSNYVFFFSDFIYF